MVENNNGLHGDSADSFEQSFQRLQQVVQRLSEGNLTLGEALAAYEEGMALADRCASMLDEAELRVKQVSERALHAGAISLSEIEAIGGETEEAQLVSIEVEGYESLVFDRATSRAEEEPGPTRGKKRTLPGEADKVAFEDLDPLFDEDD
jgi:exodeoxyribonuclease VII small subunit